MRRLLIALLCPVLATAQSESNLVFKSNLSYPKLEASGDGMFGFERDDKFGYMDKTEKIIIPPIYSYESSTYKTIPYFNNGHARVKKEGKFGLIDKTGKVVIPFEYETLTPVPKLRAYATVSRNSGNKALYGLAGPQNKIVIPLEYSEILADSNLIAVKQDGKWGLFDYTGKRLLPSEYTSLIPYPKDRMVRAEKDNKFGFIDLSGKWLFEKAKNVFTLYSPSNGMILCSVNGKYGYLDYTGEEAIITKYDNAYGFETVGLAKAGKRNPSSTYSNFYGYIDKKGTEIIPIKYETIGSFSNGLVYVKDPETNRYGYMDKTGKWAVKAVYLDAGGFDVHGGAWVKMTDGKYHYINKTGKDLGVWEGTTYRNFDAEGYTTYEYADYPYALVDKNGKAVKKLDDADGVYTFSQGIAGYKCKSNSKYGFIDVTGKIISPCTYDGFTIFSDGVTRVETLVSGKTKYGYMDEKGQTILPAEHDYLLSFRNGWGVMKKDGNYFFVDKSGNLKEAPRKYDELTEFRSGYSVGTVKGTNANTYYYVNTQLKEEFNVTAKQAWQFWDDVAIVNRSGVYEMMNKKGEIFKKLDNVTEMKFSTDGMLAIKENGKWGFLDNSGNKVIAAKYDSCDQFKYGYGRIRLGSKWGIVDKVGNEIVPPKYENILPGENDLFIYFDKYWAVIDKTGRVLVPPTFYSITPFEKDRALARLGKSYSILKSPLAK